MISQNDNNEDYSQPEKYVYSPAENLQIASSSPINTDSKQSSFSPLGEATTSALAYITQSLTPVSPGYGQAAANPPNNIQNMEQVASSQPVSSESDSEQEGELSDSNNEINPSSEIQDSDNYGDSTLINENANENNADGNNDSVFDNSNDSLSMVVSGQTVDAVDDQTATSSEEITNISIINENVDENNLFMATSSSSFLKNGRIQNEAAQDSIHKIKKKRSKLPKKSVSSHKKTIIHKRNKNENGSIIYSKRKSPLVINEIMWAGSEASPDDQWIELYNRSARNLNLNNYLLDSEDGSFSINLKNHIGPKQYYLIKKTKITLPDIKTDLIADFDLKNSSYQPKVLRLIHLKKNQKIILDHTPTIEACDGRWCAGEAAPDYSSMERICPAVSGNLPSNWQTNNKKVKNGHDKNGNEVMGTPNEKNSVSGKSF